MKHLFHVKLLLILFLFSSSVYSQNFSKTTFEVRTLPVLPKKNPEIERLYWAAPAYKSSSEQIREWFYWTNYSRLNPIVFWDSVVAPVLQVYPELQSSYTRSLKKDLYSLTTLPPFMPNQTLKELAQGHAADMAKNSSSPSHTSTNGTPFQQRIAKVGIQQCAAENLSLGPSNAVLALIFLYIDEGIPDLGHRKTLLNPYYTELGIGISQYRNKSYMVVQDFACDQTKE